MGNKTQKENWRLMLRSLARVMDPGSGAEALALVTALTWASGAGEKAEQIHWELEWRISKMMRGAPTTGATVRQTVRELVEHCELTLPRIGLDTTDAFPTPHTLVRVVRKVYPPKEFPRVVDVAGGKGTYARELVRAGYRVTIIDPKGSRSKKLRVRKKKFLVGDADGFDLVFAFRPCDASNKVARAAKRRPTVLVPCGCRRVWPSGKAPMPAASAFLRELGVPFRRLGMVLLTGEQATRRGALRGVTA